MKIAFKAVKDRVLFFVSNGLFVEEDDITRDLVPQIIIVHLLFILAIFLLTFFAIQVFASGEILIGIIDVVTAFLFVFLLVLLRRTQYVRLTIGLGVTIIGLFFAFMFYSTGIANSGHVWVMLFPLIALFFLGVRLGLFSSFLLLLLLIVLEVFHITASPYGFEFMKRFVGAFIAVTSIATLFEHIRAKSQLRINKKNVELKNHVADLKKIKNALHENEAKFRHLVEKAHESIVIVQNGKVRYVNPPMAELIGYEREEVINLAISRFISFDMLNRLKNHLISSRDKTENLAVFETELQHKNGTQILVEANIGKAKFEGKTAVFLFFRDIRIRRKQDVEKIKMGKLESISTLADGMAHDFNNLLTIILGNASIMKNRVKDSEKLSRSVEKIEDASVRASKLVKQFFDFSQSGQSKKQKLRLGELLRGVLGGLFDSKTYRLKVNIADDLWPIECNPIQIEEVVSKMCSNAKDAMSGGGVVEFTAENFEAGDESSQPAKGKYNVLKIRDEGVGIPRENIAKIFDPYFSTKKSVTEKGIGFGLSIVQNIVYNHGGTIQVDSEPEKGTTFFLYFPAQPE